jgi:hypothetical protein
MVHRIFPKAEIFPSNKGMLWPQGILMFPTDPAPAKPVCSSGPLLVTLEQDDESQANGI